MYLISFILIIISITHIVLNAITDGRKDKTGSTLHWTRSLGVLLLITAFYAQYFYGFDPWFLVYYVLLRFAIFDTVYNDVTGNDLNYHGNTNHIWVKFLNLIPPQIERILRGISFVIPFILAGLYYHYN